MLKISRIRCYIAPDNDFIQQYSTFVIAILLILTGDTNIAKLTDTGGRRHIAMRYCAASCRRRSTESTERILAVRWNKLVIEILSCFKGEADCKE